ncbi:MAG: GntR family transcriptional regulator [Nocardiopsaceae bacterium]|nr:GntR family transcriptional regulator [Nocardiopsaceae bacterium]
MTAERRTRSGTTVDDLYRVLRDRIIDGVYGPGYRMSQEDLAADLEVSRTPLREALRRLQADGFLVGTANRGMQVAPVANADTEQHYALRILVEPPVISGLLAQVTGEDLAQMQAALDDMAASLDRTRELQEAHKRFHDVALTRYPPAIRDLTRQLHTMIYRHQRIFFSRPRTPDDLVRTDEMYLEAMRRRDADSVRQLLEFHLLDAALGLVIDSDPDHQFDTLLLALAGNGIELEHDPKNRVPLGARVRWTRRDAAAMPALSTTNLRYAPGA